MSEKKKILMVDDEDDLCLMVKENLEEKGNFEVTTTNKPMDVEKLVKELQPDVILLDVVMPERKGTEIITALKDDPEIKRIPVIVVSGKGEMVYDKKKDEFKWMPNSPLVKDRGDMPDIKGAEALAEFYNVADYISKPYTTDLVLEVINEVITKYQKMAEAEEEKEDL